MKIHTTIADTISVFSSNVCLLNVIEVLTFKKGGFADQSTFHTWTVVVNAFNFACFDLYVLNIQNVLKPCI